MGISEASPRGAPRGVWRRCSCPTDNQPRSYGGDGRLRRPKPDVREDVEEKLVLQERKSHGGNSRAAWKVPFVLSPLRHLARPLETAAAAAGAGAEGMIGSVDPVHGLWAGVYAPASGICHVYMHHMREKDARRCGQHVF